MSRAQAKGVYSIIQFCPNLERREAVNVGVILLCEDRAYIDAKVTRAISRTVTRRFRHVPFDPEQLRIVISAAGRMVKVEDRRIQSEKDLYTLSRTRANHVLITEPAFVKVLDPQETLQRLFLDLVNAGDVQKQTRKPVEAVARKKFEQAGVLDQLLEDQSVVVPFFNEELRVPFAFRNGRLNLIKPHRFQSNGLKGEIASLALKGHYIHRDRDAKLHVIAEFDGGIRDHVEEARSLFEDQDAELHEVGALDKLCAEIKESARP